MDHEVEDHAHLGTAGVELGQAVHFNEHGVEGAVLYGKKSWVEAFHMADLQLDTGFLHQLYDLPGLVYRVGQGLFHEHMAAFADGLLADAKMVVGRRHNVYHLAGIDELVFGGIAADAVFGSHRFCGTVVRVEEAHQLHAGNIFPVVQVELTQMTRAKNADTQHAV